MKSTTARNYILTSGHSGQTKLVVSIIKCFTSWLEAGTISVVNIEQQPVMIESFRILQNAQADPALHDAATDCVCFLLYQVQTFLTSFHITD